MSRLPHPVVLVGAGKMGGALLAGWLDRGPPAAEAWVVEPDEVRRGALAEKGPLHLVERLSDLPGELRPSALVLAVKPQVMDEVVRQAADVASRAGFVLSIAAGKPVVAFEGAFGASKAIVRAMPNTPAAIGRGMTVLFANPATDAARRAAAEALMAAVGDVAWVEDEEWMHAVTAVSGSGPAYVFHLVEALAQAARECGLPGELADRLARRTVEGAGALLAACPDPPRALREAVTSPGGTTQAALEVLMAEDGLAALLTRAVQAAARRSRELA